MVLGPVLILVLLAAGIGYVRLLHGPVSLKPLARTIERSIAAELSGAGVEIDDAELRLTDGGGLQFRLRGLRISDGDGRPVAGAPLAAVELASGGLWRGRLVPTRIDLIDPRLILVRQADGGLSLSFSRPEEPPSPTPSASPVPAPGRPPAPAEVPADGGGATGLPASFERIDLARALATATARARRGEDATASLKEIGLRNAVVVIQQAGRSSLWRVPEMSVDLEHRESRSILNGKLTVVSGRGPWSIVFRAEESETSQTIAVDASIRDLVPRSLAEAAPDLALLDGFDLPVGGDASFELSTAGELMSGTVKVELGRGRIHLPWLEGAPVPVDAGLVDLRYRRDQRRIEVAPSTLRWGSSQITLAGDLASVRTRNGAEGWRFDLKALDGRLAAEEYGVAAIPVELWIARGTVSAAERALNLERFELRAGGAGIAIAGAVEAAGETPNARFEGQIGAMPVSTFKALWPRSLAPGAREFVGERVSRGQVLGGTLKWLSGAGLEGDRGAPETAGSRLSLSIEASDVTMRPMKSMLPIEMPRLLVRLEGGAIELNAPDASIIVAPQRRVALKGARFTAVHLFGEKPIGEIVFRGQGPAGAVLEAVDQEPLQLMRRAGLPTAGVDGKVEAQLKITLPLLKDVELAEIKLDGRVRVAELRAKGLAGPYDVQGGSITLDLAERTAEARGEILVNGVLAKLHWQRFFEPGPAQVRQPPLEISALLDSADRTQLGLDVNDIVQGESAVLITVDRLGGEEPPQVRVRADLTNADLVLEALAWRKPPGRTALLELDIAGLKTQRLELQNIRLSGDDVAIEGSAVAGGDSRLREFSLPRVSLNVVTRLEVEGKLRPDNVWDVKVRGQTFEGRNLFRSLFSVGQLTETPVKPAKPAAGVDISAEIGTVVGFSEVALRNVRLRASKRGDRLVGLEAQGTLDGGKPLAVRLVPGDKQSRQLQADSTDAGQALKLIGFYPNMQGGRLRLEVNLDGRGAAEKTGTLWVEEFRVLGDPIVSEVVSTAESGPPARGGQRRVTREVFDFDRLRVPFSVGHGQFVLEDSYARGPLVGANLRGKVDFKAGRMSLGGTYIPLQGLNNVLGGIPVIGDILSGPRKEGIFGVTFAVNGAMDQPQVSFHPLSPFAPGIFREIFQMTNPDPRVVPRAPASPAAPTGGSVRASSSTAVAPKAATGGQRAPEVIDGWSSQTAPARK